MATTTIPASLVPSHYGKNLLLNPLFNVNQRGYVSGTATGGSNQYTVDRWRVVTTGQNLTFSGGVATAPAGGVEQVIEGSNILLTGTYVLNWTGTATATVGGVAVLKGGTFTLTAGSNATVRFTGGTVSYPQVEYGSVPTSFQIRDFVGELALCMRYYEKSYEYTATPGTASSTGSIVLYSPVTGSWAIQGRYTVRKRVAVNPTFYSTTGESGYARDATAGSNVGATVGWAGETAFRADTTGAAGHAFNLHWTCEAEITT